MNLTMVVGSEYSYCLSPCGFCQRVYPKMSHCQSATPSDCVTSHYPGAIASDPCWSLLVFVCLHCLCGHLWPRYPEPSFCCDVSLCHVCSQPLKFLQLEGAHLKCTSLCPTNYKHTEISLPNFYHFS